MQLKDYYKILEVSPVATAQEIKKSFRRLAQLYHPDKNAGNHMAEAQFKEIREAYEVLSDPQQRKEYNYKRWHLRSTGNQYTKTPLSPAAILQECLQLQRYVESMSIFRINYDAVSQHIRHLINPDSIGILHEYNQPETNRAIVATLLASMRPLPLRYFTPIAALLHQIAGTDTVTNQSIEQQGREKKWRERWERYQWIVVVIITLLLCWLMYVVAA
jgi:molecular chaperone DnaJ